MRALWLALVLVVAAPAAAQPRPAGDIDRTVIREVIRQHLGQMRACYERVLQSGRPGVSGRVVVTFTIAPNGKVPTATLRDSELADPQAEACILSAFQAMRFPPFAGRGSITITYPLIFRPAS